MTLTPVNRHLSNAGKLVFKRLTLLEINGKQRSRPAPARCAAGNHAGGNNDKEIFN
jgi:hypothetical protein